MAVNYNFQKIPEKVSAFRFGFDAPPAWFTYAVSNKLIEQHSNEEAGKPPSIRIKNKYITHEPIYAHHGDWIILDEKEQIYARRNELFRKLFERV